MSRMLHALRQLETKSESFAPAVDQEPAGDADAAWSVEPDEPAAPAAPLDLTAALQVAAKVEVEPGPTGDAEPTPSSTETAEAAMAAFDGLTALLGQTARHPSNGVAPPELDAPQAVPVVEDAPASRDASPEAPEFVELPQFDAAPLDLTELMRSDRQAPAQADAHVPAEWVKPDEPEALIGEPPSTMAAPVAEQFSADAAIEPAPPPEVELAAPRVSNPVPARRAVAPLEAKILDESADGALSRQVGSLAAIVDGEFAGATSTALMLVGADAGDHGALVAAHLGAAMAARRAGGVLLIDANSATRDLTAGLGLTGRSGVAEILSDTNDGDLTAVYPAASLDVSVLPAGRNVALGAADLDARVSVLIRELGRQQRWIIVHGGAAESTLTRAFGRSCDGVYLLVRIGQTTPEEARQTLESLQNAGALVLGCIATNVHV
jgi:Mrp family chromosome partitioning ATPase